MLTKQTIVIMGAGVTGRAIAACLATGNFHVLLCDKDHVQAEAAEKELKDKGQPCDVESMACFFDGAWEADIIILAMDFEEQKEVAGVIKEVANQKILVSTVQPGAEMVAAPATEGCQLTTLQRLLPNTKIVRIFPDVAANASPDICKSITSILIAGNDNEAVETVSGMLKSVGVNPTRTNHLPADASENNRTL